MLRRRKNPSYCDFDGEKIVSTILLFVVKYSTKHKIKRIGFKNHNRTDIYFNLVRIVILTNQNSSRSFPRIRVTKGNFFLYNFLKRTGIV